MAQLDPGMRAVVTGIIGSTAKQKDFGNVLMAHSNSGKFSSVFAMTHAMFELAHVGDKYNPVLPKWIIQQRLKIVIPSEDFAKLQDAYTKAVVEKGDVESAKSALYAWLKENEAKLTFDKGKYLPKN